MSNSLYTCITRAVLFFVFYNPDDVWRDEWTRADDLLVFERIISAIYIYISRVNFAECFKDTFDTMFRLILHRVKILIADINRFLSVYSKKHISRYETWKRPNTDEENSLLRGFIDARARIPMFARLFIYNWSVCDLPFSPSYFLCAILQLSISFETILPNIMQITMNFAEGKSTRLTQTHARSHTHTHTHTHKR